MTTDTPRASPAVPVRALEFYSGIGGMHYSLNRACKESAVLAAFDLNNVANDVRRWTCGIE
eukprot:7121987-Pyramimonas_sp.AAC.1